MCSTGAHLLISAALQQGLLLEAAGSSSSSARPWQVTCQTLQALKVSRLCAAQQKWLSS
jgi:hypothetical protein